MRRLLPSPDQAESFSRFAARSVKADWLRDAGSRAMDDGRAGNERGLSQEEFSSCGSPLCSPKVVRPCGNPCFAKDFPARFHQIFLK